MLFMKLKRHNSVMVKYKDLRFTKCREKTDRKYTELLLILIALYIGYSNIALY